jgi:hypothetical protein
MSTFATYMEYPVRRAAGGDNGVADNEVGVRAGDNLALINRLEAAVDNRRAVADNSRAAHHNHDYYFNTTS